MKTKTLLIAAVMFLGISVAAFAQAQYSVSASPVTTAVSTGYTEKVGDIGFNTIDASNYTVTGTITIDYNTTITADTDDILISAFNADAAGTVLPAFTRTVEGDSVVITITPDFTNPARLYSFRLSGVRVDVHGDSGAAPIDAVVTSTNNMIVNGQAMARVLNQIDLPFASFENNTAEISALDGEVTGQTVTLVATEKFRFALGVTQATDPTQNAVQQLKIVLDRAVPAGVTLNFATADHSGNWVLVGTNSEMTAADGATPTLFYRLNADTDVTEVEEVEIDVEVTAAAPTTTVYSTDLTMFAKITLAPIHVANSTVIPRYAESYLTSEAIYTFFAAYDKTVLMVPYATTVSGYDTGIAIANTTLDPGSSLTGFVSPLQQDGKITFYFYPNVGDPFSVDTVTDLAALPNQSIIPDGLLPAGKTYVALLSELVAAAEVEDPFTGYIIAVCDFTHAHGQYFISDFGDFTNGALMLVITTTEPTNRALSVPESLGN